MNGTNELVFADAQRAHQRHRRAARIVGKQLERDRERFGGAAFDQRAGVLPRLRILDRELSRSRSANVIFAPPSASFSRSLPIAPRSASLAASAAITRGSAFAPSRASVSFTKRSRTSALAVVSMRSAAAPASAPNVSGFVFLLGGEQVFEHERVAGGHRFARPPRVRAAAARASARTPRTTTTRRSARNGIAATASLDARQILVAGAVEDFEIERAHVGRDKRSSKHLERALRRGAIPSPR